MVRKFTVEQATKIAQNYVKNEEVASGCELALLIDSMIEFDGGWVFFYDSQRYLETGAFDDMILGNSPIIVSSENGEVVETGTSEEIEYYIGKYQKGDL